MKKQNHHDMDPTDYGYNYYHRHHSNGTYTIIKWVCIALVVTVAVICANDYLFLKFE